MDFITLLLLIIFAVDIVMTIQYEKRQKKREKELVNLAYQAGIQNMQKYTTETIDKVVEDLRKTIAEKSRKEV